MKRSALLIQDIDVELLLTVLLISAEARPAGIYGFIYPPRHFFEYSLR